MTDDPTPNMTLLLNKAEAIIDCGAGRSEELAKYLGKTRQQVYAWIRSRRPKPDGETTFGIQKWVARKTLQVSVGGPQIGNRYREAFKVIVEKRSRQREKEEN